MPNHSSGHRIRVGIAGWSYDDWNGTVYPRPMPRGVDRLTYVARYVDMVEVNSTFYRPATARMAEGWVAKTEGAPDFRFTAKLWRRFTHEREEGWTRDEERAAKAALDVLHGAGKLGAVLIQFPWSFKRDDENRIWLGDVVDAFRAYPLVVEIRHESWNDPEFYQHLAEEGVGFVNVDQPLFAKSIKPSATVTSSVGYVRVHGRNYATWWKKSATGAERYDYLYTPDELRPWVKRTEQIANDANEVYVVTNNHRSGKGFVNAAQMKAMLEHAEVAVPPVLFETYPDALHGYAHPVA